MRRPPTGLLIGFAVFVLALAAYAAWAFRAAGRVGLGWAGLAGAWPFLLAGVATAAVVIAAFMRLAVISERKGFDDEAGGGEP